jgi:radical SAM superfamily enzyme
MTTQRISKFFSFFGRKTSKVKVGQGATKPLTSKEKEVLELLAELNRKCDALAIEVDLQIARNKLTRTLPFE